MRVKQWRVTKIMDMMEFNRKVWSRYLECEYDFIQIMKGVEFTDDNFGCYSKNNIDLMLIIGSLVDNSCKQLCEFIISPKKAKCMDDYRGRLKGFKGFHNASVFFKEDGNNYSPWESWNEDVNPIWWKAYNHVKHNSIENEREATLINVFNALSALFIVNRYLCREVAHGARLNEPKERSELFEMVGWPIVKPAGAGMVRVEEKIDGHSGIALYKE